MIFADLGGNVALILGDKRLKLDYDQLDLRKTTVTLNVNGEEKVCVYRVSSTAKWCRDRQKITPSNSHFVCHE